MVTLFDIDGELFLLRFTTIKSTSLSRLAYTVSQKERNATEIARIHNLSISPVTQQLKKLTKAGILKRKDGKLKNQKLYSIDYDGVIDLFIKTAAVYTTVNVDLTCEHRTPLKKILTHAFQKAEGARYPPSIEQLFTNLIKVVILQPTKFSYLNDKEKHYMKDLSVRLTEIEFRKTQFKFFN